MAYYHQYRGKVNHETPIEEGVTYCGLNTTFMDKMRFHDDGNRPCCLGCENKKEKLKKKSPTLGAEEKSK